MTSFEEETYSSIFTSLNHSVRRKILKMLAEEPRSFSDMFESLGISSSHFNYHLDNLGELVSKTEDGKYKLSFLGEAAMAMMSKVEETPHVTHHSSGFLSKNWKYISLLLIIGFAFLASANYLQYSALAKISEDNQMLLNSNELLWDCYTSMLVSSDDAPPISKTEAIKIGLRGEWNTQNLQGMVVNAKLVIFKFEVKLMQISVLEEPIKRLIPVARMYEVTEKVTSYAPVTDANGTYRYIWEITVRPAQEYLDRNFSSAPSAIYHVDANDGQSYQGLYELLYIDGDD
ncbi:MAG: winged helix-turn-helix transcriptional regulator [Candidatus Bathyarchaeota archaeon]|nr:winged helix-turn-helix domain-containing protein [Candidatus Bathyarchaeum tardum]WGM89714.1 MAG: winged helix-turn-helix domain-containing protein [Candidatus Bathyarchaeum tardum]WNZ30189.1 MAG: winged helix-turn-helix transcriptional regulator [Candidatus Bathyarchaeota archaeon]